MGQPSARRPCMAPMRSGEVDVLALTSLEGRQQRSLHRSAAEAACMRGWVRPCRISYLSLAATSRPW